MTVSTIENKIVYAGQIFQNTFAYNFRVDEKEDMLVYLAGILIDDTEWTITQLGNPAGGTVILNVALIEELSVTLYRYIPPLQGIDYTPFDAFPAETHEQGLDTLTFITQQLEEMLLRAFKFPIDAPPGQDFSLPPWKGGAVIGWDENIVNLLVNSPYVFQDYVDLAERAEIAAEASEDSAELANDFANEDEDIPVQESGLFSAKHWAIKAAKATGGLRLRAIIAGDNNCPKIGDDVGDCTFPDHRNPGVRFPGTVHLQGDYYLISSEGDMLLKDIEDPEGPETIQFVGIQDYIIFFNDIIDEGDVIIGEGFYRFDAIDGGTTSADKVTFDDGQTVIKGEQLQIWNSAADFAIEDLTARVGDNEVDILAHNVRITTNEFDIDANTNAIPAGDAINAQAIIDGDEANDEARILGDDALAIAITDGDELNALAIILGDEDNDLSRIAGDNALAIAITDGDALRVLKAGDVMSGELTSPRFVMSAIQGTDAGDATRLDYVDGLDDQNVKLTETQFIAGIKTFSDNPIHSGLQSASEDALTKREYVDELDDENVKVSGDQNVGGEKQFSTNPRSLSSQSGFADAVTRKDYVDDSDDFLLDIIQDNAAHTITTLEPQLLLLAADPEGPLEQTLPLSTPEIFMAVRTQNNSSPSDALLQLNEFGQIDLELIPISGVTLVGFWNIDDDGPTPPVTVVHAAAYVVVDDGDMTLFELDNQTPHTVTLKANDKFLGLVNAEAPNFVTGWYFWPTPTTETLPALNVIFNNLGTDYDSDNVQAALEEIDGVSGTNKMIKAAGDTMTGPLAGVAPTAITHLTRRDYVDDADEVVADAALAAQNTANTALSNAAIADGKAVAAQGTADAALTDAAAADAKAVAAQTTASEALADAATADAKAVTADAKAVAADVKAVAAQGTADTALANAATADGKAVAAQGTANTALSTANAAMPRTGGDFSGIIGLSPGSAADHALQKTQIDTAIADAIAGVPTSPVKPVGAVEIGWNPNGILVGVWTQWAEGTFVMNTVAGSEVNGGDNNAVAIAHTHNVTDPGHTHEITWGVNSSNTGSHREASQSGSNTRPSGSRVTGIGIVSSGVAGTNLNRPRFKGVAVWERTS